MAKLHWESGKKAAVARERGTILVRPKVVDWARHPEVTAERELLNRIAHQKVNYGLVHTPATPQETEKARREAVRAYAVERASEALQASLRVFRALLAEFQRLAPLERVNMYAAVQAKAQALQHEATQSGVVEGVNGWSEVLALQTRLQQAYEEGQREARLAKRRRSRR